MKVEIALAGSSILYHLIEMEHAITALQKDRFRLAPTNEGVEAEFGDHQYFLSLARSKHSDYFKKEAGSTHVIFVLDGQKMGHNYKIMAVDYWASQKYVNNDEKEDRLFSHKRFIPCIRYVTEIHFMKEGGKFQSNDSLTLALLAKRNKIPLFQYDDLNAFMNLDKRKTIKLDVRAKKKRKFGLPHFHEYTDGMLKAWYMAARFVFKPTGDHYRQFYAGAKIKVDQNARDRVARTIKNMNRYTEIQDSDVRDFRRLLDQAQENEKVYVEKIHRIIRSERTDVKGFLDYVRKRWMTAEERELHGIAA